jgi:hypothetical protein
LKRGLSSASRSTVSTTPVVDRLGEVALANDQDQSSEARSRRARLIA